MSLLARWAFSNAYSVYKWHRRCLCSGRKALQAIPHPGKPPKLDARQVQQLSRILLQGPSAYGFSNELWTLPRVAKVIKRSFGVSYDPSGIWHVLHRMGWSCQKPERRARERDEDAIARWRKFDWPRIKKRA